METILLVCCIQTGVIGFIVGILLRRYYETQKA